jgi:hypothetical protein
MICRGGRIRTGDLLVPNQTRYQAALHPVALESLLVAEGVRRDARRQRKRSLDERLVLRLDWRCLRVVVLHDLHADALA